MAIPVALADVLAVRDAVTGLGAAAVALSNRYRAGVDEASPGVSTGLDREAYVVVRMPATAAAVDAALASALEVTTPTLGSHLDLGSGTGAALWAAAGLLPSLTRQTAVERDRRFIDLAKQLATDAPLPPCTWTEADLRQLPTLEQHDLVTVSYAINELTAEEGQALVDQAWALTGAWLLLVEPGTPRGFATIAAARRRLLAAGAHPVGPCTHAATCPLDGTTPAGAPGWCHQRVRLPRSRLHRAAKGADLGWEDEPFSWLLVSRTPVALAGARVLATPRVHKGAVDMQLCTADGFTAISVPRRDRVAYKEAAELEWGDRT